MQCKPPSSYQYDPFGALNYDSSWEKDGTSSFLFAGEQLDLSSLYYLRARYYDPTTGRFLQMDPFPGITTLPDTLNPYLYTLNNPVNFVDPSGRFIFLAILAAGFIGGFLGGVAYYTLEMLSNIGCWNPGEAMIWGAGGAILGAILATIGYGGWWIGTQMGWWGVAGTGGTITAVSADGDPTNEVTEAVDTVGNAVNYVGHHTIPSQILNMLPEDIANAVRDCFKSQMVSSFSMRRVLAR